MACWHPIHPLSLSPKKDAHIMATQSPKSQTSSKPQSLDFARGVPLRALEDNVPVQGHVNGTDVVVAKRGASIFAVGARCSHYGAPLHTGRVSERGIHCPWHHACFRLEDGSIERAPAMDPIASFATRVQDGVVTLVPEAKAHAPQRRAHQAPPSVTIVGLGAAGMGAAAALRQSGYPGPITAFGAEPHGPYDRIKLSKGFLSGAVPADGLALDSVATQKGGITVRCGVSVRAIDSAQQLLHLDDGSLHPYHALLLATGATPKRLDVPGGNSPHVHVLRSLDDAQKLLAAARGHKHVVIVGASFIGLEAAASLRKLGLAVDVVATDNDAPMAKVLGPTLAQKIALAHAQAGVTVHRGRSVTAIQPDQVVLDDGTKLATELVLIAIGVAPNDALAREAGLKVQDGIVVDAQLRTSHDHIFAAGDVAAYPFAAQRPPQRIEHWAVAMQMGRVAAHTLQGENARLEATPFFWTEHHNIKVRYVGHAPKGAQEKVWGDSASQTLAVALYDGAQVAAVVTVGCDAVSLEAEAALDAGLAHKVPGLLTRALGEPKLGAANF